MTRGRALSLFLVFAGAAVLVVGVWLLAGRGWALAAAGAVLMAIGLFVVEEDSPALAKPLGRGRRT